jgi:hypothetical protein
MFRSDQTPLHEARHKIIAEKAYYYWEQRGRPIGSPEVDWLQAEREVDREAPWSSGEHQNTQPQLPAKSAKQIEPSGSIKREAYPAAVSTTPSFRSGKKSK